MKRREDDGGSRASNDRHLFMGDIRPAFPGSMSCPSIHMSARQRNAETTTPEVCTGINLLKSPGLFVRFS